MKAIVLSWNQARVDVVETCSLASAGELSVLFTCGTRARWSSTTRAGLRAQFTALSQHFARVSVETIGYTFYRHYIFCFYNGRKLLVSRRGYAAVRGCRAISVGEQTTHRYFSQGERSNGIRVARLSAGATQGR